MAVATRMSLDEFLALPETEPASEFVCGRIVPKPMPTLAHGFFGAWLIWYLQEYFQAHPLGIVVTEARHANRDEDRAYLPDVGVILRRNIPRSRAAIMRGPLEMRPDLAVEILSPDDRPGRVADKLAFYLRTGVPLTWIIDLEEQTLTAYRPGEPSSIHQPPEVIAAAPVLPGFTLDLGRFFGQLDLVNA